MQQALAAPVLKSIVFASLALGLGAAYVGITDHSVSRRLVLHAVDEPDALYLTAFRNGDLNLVFEDTELQPMTFHIKAHLSDGCRWLGIETLVPLDARTYHYDYNEAILECEPGAKPARKTPRTGRVSVH
ncbi:MAG: hypothetical protein H0T79_04270 [Deltaproteobacteria bacterium]|nr:hypothetical protein [Deltaproteobacteria bacterium]